ncbi:MAG TPA: ABC transporter ATP-binding protein [Acidobacteriota bacterium]|nr:ABC transporter ATP-binding protein [Acidobacteriota bacterium]
MNDGYLALSGISKSFTARGVTTQVLDGIDLRVADREFVALIGSSGCGKSTLINIIAGLLTFDEGYLSLGGRPISGPGADRGVVFQDDVLLPWLTALDNLCFALDCTMSAASVRQRRRLAGKYLRLVGLAEAFDKKPNQLSGGMRQRVCIARAFAIQPRVLLLDEPFGALDALTRLTLQDQLLQVWEAERKIVVMVTHDVDEAIKLSDRILVMSDGPSAKIKQEVAVPFRRPRDMGRLLREPRFYELRAALLSMLQGEGGFRPGSPADGIHSRIPGQERIGADAALLASAARAGHSSNDALGFGGEMRYKVPSPNSEDQSE